VALPAADAALLRLKGGAKKEKPDGYEAFQPPKRALTAYMIFSNKIRPELMKANPELKITEVSKHIAEKWKALADGDKAALQKQAEALKVAYDKKKAEYEAKVPQEVRQARSVAAKKKKAGKPAKDPNAPKKPLSAFMIFSNKVREEFVPSRLIFLSARPDARLLKCGTARHQRRRSPLKRRLSSFARSFWFSRPNMRPRSHLSRVWKRSRRKTRVTRRTSPTRVWTRKRTSKGGETTKVGK